MPAGMYSWKPQGNGLLGLESPDEGLEELPGSVHNPRGELDG